MSRELTDAFNNAKSDQQVKRGEGQDPVGGVSASVMGSWVHRGTGGGTWGILYRVQGKRYMRYRVKVHGYRSGTWVSGRRRPRHSYQPVTGVIY